MLEGFFKDEAGASVLEYSFLVTLIALVIISAILGLSHTVSSMFTSISSTIVTTTGS